MTDPSEVPISGQSRTAKPAVRLRRLTLVPTGGIGNRLRAIASAHRLCQQTGAHCTVIWDWGVFEDFFCTLPDVEFLPPTAAAPGTELHRQLSRPVGSEPRCIDVMAETVALTSGAIIWGSHEGPIRDWSVLRPFLPSLNARLAECVETFAQRHSIPLAVGLHLRRTDQKIAARCSPDRLFIAAAREAASNGRNVFLATDSLATEMRMRESLPGTVITYRKRGDIAQRWPRKFDHEATEDDAIELFLLARTDYLFGSYWSSYSHLALVLNGSDRCAILYSPWRVFVEQCRRRLKSWRERFWRERARRLRMSVLPTQNRRPWARE